MLEAQGEPERSSACNRANPGRKERRGFHPVGRNFARIVGLLASIPSHLSGGQSLTKALDSIRAFCARHRHAALAAQHQTLSQKVRGHYVYFGRPGNTDALERFLWEVRRIWKKWLSRRSSKGALSWERWLVLEERYPLPQPYITPRPRSARVP